MKSRTFTVATLLCASIAISSCGKLSALRDLAENHAGLTGSRALELLQQLDSKESFILSMYPAFAGNVLLNACNANSNLQWSLLGVQDTCYTAQAKLEQHVALFATGTMIGKWDDQIQSERLSILIMLKCDSGEIDAGSCSMYTGAMSNFNAQNHDTSMSIINNMGGNNCQIGVDANCY
jgi:hypothetical protein